MGNSKGKLACEAFEDCRVLLESSGSASSNGMAWLILALSTSFLMYFTRAKDLTEMLHETCPWRVDLNFVLDARRFRFRTGEKLSKDSKVT